MHFRDSLVPDVKFSVNSIPKLGFFILWTSLSSGSVVKGILKTFYQHWDELKKNPDFIRCEYILTRRGLDSILIILNGKTPEDALLGSSISTGSVRSINQSNCEPLEARPGGRSDVEADDNVSFRRF